jgi:hypothetical protein
MYIVQYWKTRQFYTFALTQNLFLLISINLWNQTIYRLILLEIREKIEILAPFMYVIPPPPTMNTSRILH